MACYDRGNWFESSDRHFCICYFLTCKQPCELVFTGFMIKYCLKNTGAKQLRVFYSRRIVCLLMRNQNTHKNVNYTINTVVTYEIYVCAVFKSVGTKYWIWADSRPLDYNPRFRPLRCYSQYQLFATVKTIKNPIADYCPYILRTPPNTCRKLICRVHWPYNQYAFDRSITLDNS